MKAIVKACKVLIWSVGCLFALGFGLTIGAVADAGLTGNGTVYLAAAANSLLCTAANNTVQIGGDTWEFNCASQTFDSIGAVPITVRAGAGTGGVPLNLQTIGAGGAMNMHVGAGATLAIDRQSDSTQLETCQTSGTLGCTFPQAVTIGTNSPAPVKLVYRRTATLNPASVTNGSTDTDDLGNSGLVVGSMCEVVPTTLPAGCIAQCFVTGATDIDLRTTCFGTVDIASQSWTFTIVGF